jgi:excisionase family DNA binding protein
MREHTRQLLTVRDAARAGRVSEITVRRAIAAGTLPALRVGGHYRLLRLDAAAYDAWLDGAQPRPRGDAA